MEPRHILVVDDDLSLLKVLTRLLTTLGYKVTALSKSKEAVDVIGKNSFAAVMTDEVMPDLTGRELASEIKKHWPEMPVVLLTGLTDVVAQETVFDAILSKPMTFPAVKETLARLIKS
jgi:DNA-binding NtrC family response regulator